MRLLAILGAFAVLFGFIVLILRFAIGRYIDHLSRTEIPAEDPSPSPEQPQSEPEPESSPAPYEGAWLNAIRAADPKAGPPDREIELPCPICNAPVRFSFKEAPAKKQCAEGHIVRFPRDPRASRIPVCRRCGASMRYEPQGWYLCMDPECRHRFTGKTEEAERCGELMLM